MSNNENAVKDYLRTEHLRSKRKLLLMLFLWGIGMVASILGSTTFFDSLLLFVMSALSALLGTKIEANMRFKKLKDKY